MAVLDRPRPDSLPAEPKRRVSRHGLDEGDLALIDEMLAMSLVERLKAAEEFANAIEKLRQARPVEP